MAKRKSINAIANPCGSRWNDYFVSSLSFSHSSIPIRHPFSLNVITQLFASLHQTIYQLKSQHSAAIVRFGIFEFYGRKKREKKVIIIKINPNVKYERATTTTETHILCVSILHNRDTDTQKDQFCVLLEMRAKNVCLSNIRKSVEPNSRTCIWQCWLLCHSVGGGSTTSSSAATNMRRCRICQRSSAHTQTSRRRRRE